GHHHSAKRDEGERCDRLRIAALKRHAAPVIVCFQELFGVRMIETIKWLCMTWIKDLSAYVKPFDGEPLLLAVGWLSGGKTYSKGLLDPSVYNKLSELLAAPWEFGPHSLGFHTCDLCNEPHRTGVRNLYVPGGEVLYVCPELILHYMAEHEYLPPV